MLCRKCPMAEIVLSSGRVMLVCPALDYQPVGSFLAAKCQLAWDDVSHVNGGDTECLADRQNPWPYSSQQ